MKKVIATLNAPEAFGPYSQAVELNGMLFISGQTPINPATGEMPSGIEAQTHQVMTNLMAILKEAGMSAKDVVKTTLLLTDINDFSVVNAVYGEYFKEAEIKPARICCQVAALPKGSKIMIDLIANK